MFTLKQIFPVLAIPSKEVQKIRYKIGRHVYSAFRSKYRRFPDTVQEDGFKVRLYPDEFRETAMTVIQRHLKKMHPAKKKRKRITRPTMEKLTTGPIARPKI